MSHRNAARLTCPDGGACHHGCSARCWRVRHCLPLSGFGERWPPEVKALHTEAGDRSHVGPVHMLYQASWTACGRGVFHPPLPDNVTREWRLVTCEDCRRRLTD